jgi:hypothetical protein
VDGIDIHQLDMLRKDRTFAYMIRFTDKRLRSLCNLQRSLGLLVCIFVRDLWFKFATLSF